MTPAWAPSRLVGGLGTCGRLLREWAACGAAALVAKLSVAVNEDEVRPEAHLAGTWRQGLDDSRFRGSAVHVVRGREDRAVLEKVVAVVGLQVNHAIEIGALIR